MTAVSSSLAILLQSKDASDTVKKALGAGQIISRRSPTLVPSTRIRFRKMTADELVISAEAAASGYPVENTGPEPLVALRYFVPDVHEDLPMNGRNT